MKFAKKAAESEPEKPEYWRVLALAHLQMNRPADARRHLKAAVAWMRDFAPDKIRVKETVTVTDVP